MTIAVALSAKPVRRRFWYRHPRLRLGALLSGPMLWLVLAYLGSLASLLLTAVFKNGAKAGTVVRSFTLSNYTKLFTDSVYMRITIRTVGIALSVTAIDMVIALPIAFTIAKLASPRVRRTLVIAVTMPLWASYLVKAYAWQILVVDHGVIEWLTKPFGGLRIGFGLNATILTLSYLWLPYMILPIYAGFERLPNSLLEAAGDLGAKAGFTFRTVVLPLVRPAIFAGSIFTFSLSLGDYITVGKVGGTLQMIGNNVQANFGTAGNLPFAAAFSTVPVLVMLVYLTLVRFTGAFESL